MSGVSAPESLGKARPNECHQEDAWLYGRVSSNTFCPLRPILPIQGREGVHDPGVRCVTHLPEISYAVIAFGSARFLARSIMERRDAQIRLCQTLVP